jgi:exodeoxyribonuclease VII large subunit
MISDRRRALREFAQGVDDLDRDLRNGMTSVMEGGRRTLAGLREALSHLSPRARQALLAQRFVRARERLEAAAVAPLRDGRKGVARLAAQLGALSPLAVLARGYSICRLKPSMEVVKDAGAVPPRSELSVRLHRGELHCRVLDSGGSGGEEEVDS